MGYWQDKGVGVLTKKGTSREREIRREDDGTHAGHSVDHWDGSNDVVAKPRTVKYKVGVRDD